jgi:hypothetical protein
MNSPVFLAAMAHIGWAALLVLATSVFASPGVCADVTLALVVYAALKEFWWDPSYELPKQTTKDNVGDFLGYVAGLLLAWLVIAAKLAL